MSQTDINSKDPLNDSVNSGDFDVIECVRHLLVTRLKERFFNPRISIIGNNFLFDLDNDDLRFVLRNRIIEGLNKWEPRVWIDTKKTEIVKTTSGTLRVNLVGKILSTGNPFKLVEEI